MSLKSVFLNFRTTTKNHRHIKAVAKKYGLPLSDVIHRMLSHFADSGDAGDTGEKLLYFVKKKHSGYGGGGSS